MAIEYKENLSQEEFNQALEEVKQGLFSREQLDNEYIAKTELEKYIDLDSHNTKIGEFETTIRELEQYKPKELNDEEKALLETKKELNKYKVKEILNKFELPSELVDFLNLKIEDEELTNKTLKQFKKIISNIQQPYNPSGHKGNSSGEMTKEDFKKLSYSDRVKLYNEDVELYNRLSK